jgi:hypothetical protein
VIKNRLTKSLLLASVLAAFAAAPVATWADDAATAPAEAAPPPINNGKLSISASNVITNAYYFRGFLNQNQGLIDQPSIYGTATVYDGTAGDPFTNLTINPGIWTSFHGTPPTATNAGSAENWYEADLSIGAGVTIFDKTTLSFTFIDYTSPDGGFTETQELDQKIAYNDAGLYGDSGCFASFTLSPYVAFAEEVAGTSKPNIVPGLTNFQKQGVYEEVGISPAWTLVDIKDYPITFSFPIVMGASVSNYYVDAAGNQKFFGYVSLGPTLSVPLSFINTKYGTWTASLGYPFYYLGEGPRDANVFNTGNTADYAHVVSFTVGFTY